MARDEATVMLVEDEASIRELCRARLRRRYRVVAADTADKALDLIRDEEKIDLLVTDLQIPAGNSGMVDPREDPLLGFVVAAEFRRVHRRSPIIAWSHARTPDVVPRIQKLGIARFVSKQTRWELVEEVIEESLCGFRSRTRPRVFIVHGHDEETVGKVCEFVKKELGFPPPIVLKNEPSGNRTVIEKLESYAEDADLVFALLTPDDEVEGLPGERVFRARPNVIFELGYFVGVLGRHTGRVIILTRQPIELPSDIKGIITIDISKDLHAARAEICQEVREWLR